MLGYRSAPTAAACFRSNSSRPPRKVTSSPRRRRGLLFRVVFWGFARAGLGWVNWRRGLGEEGSFVAKLARWFGEALDFQEHLAAHHECDGFDGEASESEPACPPRGKITAATGEESTLAG